jgi:hypothetical protein
VAADEVNKTQLENDELRKRNLLLGEPVTTMATLAEASEDRAEATVSASQSSQTQTQSESRANGNGKGNKNSRQSDFTAREKTSLCLGRACWVDTVAADPVSVVDQKKNYQC